MVCALLLSGTINKRSWLAMLTIYSVAQCPFSHQSRIVIHEKNIAANIEYLAEGEWPENVAAANPYGSGPTLIDRDLTLFDSRIINDYLDERFPHPPLMPIDPAAKAQARLTLLRMEKDWYALWEALTCGDKNSKKARQILQEDLTVLAPLFAEHPFFMGDEFSLLDCSLAPLLWRLLQFDISLPAKAGPVLDYAKRIFSRNSFQASLSEQKKVLI